MSRDITATNLAEINANHSQQVDLIKLEFDTPAYAHSGVGTITYDGDDYLGVGQFGGIGPLKESETLRPTAFTLSLSAIDPELLAVALNSGNYGDIVTSYLGYRSDDGTLVDDPIVMGRGFLNYSSVKQGDDNAVSLTIQHDLAILNESDGSRFTDEDQQRRFPGDTGFQYVTDMAGVQLQLGGRAVTGGSISKFSSNRLRQEQD